jgi:putative colanic acid biosynthesis acetyltransferase WcaF
MSKRNIDLGTYTDPKPWSYQLKRVLWLCVQFPFWVRAPRILNPIRIGLLRLFGARIGRRCIVGNARIWIPWNLEMGEFSAIGDGAEIYNFARVRVGTNSVVSQRSYLCTATHDYTKSNFPIYSLPITIGHSAWITAGVFVAPGITVGDGAVVGAYSVVTKDVPAWTVCGGNPCRVIKRRRLDDPDKPEEKKYSHERELIPPRIKP